MSLDINVTQHYHRVMLTCDAPSLRTILQPASRADADRSLVQRFVRAAAAEREARVGRDVYGSYASLAAEAGMLQELLVQALRNPETARGNLARLTDELEVKARSAVDSGMCEHCTPGQDCAVCGRAA